MVRYCANRNAHYTWTGPHDKVTESVNAKTVVKLYTGGKAVVGQKSLFCINATATQYPPPPGNVGFYGSSYMPDIWEGTQPAPVPDSALKVGKKPVDANGNLWVAYAGNSEQTITVSAQGIHHYDAGVTVTKVVPDVQLAVDLNHDGTISFGADDQTSPSNPYRFWVNDVGYSGDIISDGTDVPGSGHNGSTGQVNGRVDVINFFPVKLRIGTTSPAPPAGLEYRLAGSSSLYFAYADPTEVNDFDYLTDASGVGAYGSSLTSPFFSADTVQIKPDGVAISQGFSGKIAQHGGTGTVLMEAAAPVATPLELRVYWNNQWIYSTNLYLSISGVENMYRQVNLRPGGSTADPGQPNNYPDNPNGKMFLFVHGFRISASESRGWNAEVFKRLYWSGSQAMFTAVDWQGDQESWGVLPYDYYDNVKNAFMTASNLQVAVGNLPGAQKYVAGHSLGNMLISSAIVDYGMNVDAYFAINAAVPSEAYTGITNDLGMVNPDVTGLSSANGWLDYAPYLWSDGWHQLFDPSSDRRATLTWTGRFSGIQNVFHSFCSSGDEVLQIQNNPNVVPWPGRTQAWVYQEMEKGSVTGGILTSSSQAGWVSNVGWFTTVNTGHGGGVSRQLTPNEAAAIPLANLITMPFFNSFQDPNLMVADVPTGSAEAMKVDVQGAVLGGGIPALSDAAGAFMGQDMMGMENEWPQARLNDSTKLNNWLHSDMEIVAYPFTHVLYDNIANYLH